MIGEPVRLKSRPLTGQAVIDGYSRGKFKLRLNVGGIVWRRREDFIIHCPYKPRTFSEHNS